MKNWKLWLTCLLLVGFTVAPFIWDAWFNSSHYPIDWQAWWSFGTFAIAVIAAGIAYNEYHVHEVEAKKAARQRTEDHIARKIKAREAAEQREKDYIRQVRPYVTVRITFERGVHFLELKNIGKTPAEHISLTVDSRILELCKQTDFVNKLLKHAISTPFTFLAPGQRLIFFICTGGEASQAYREGKNLSFPASIVYSNMDGLSFTDEYSMDIGDYVDTTREEDSVEKIGTLLKKQNTLIEKDARTRVKQMDYLISALNKVANQTSSNARVMRILRRQQTRRSRNRGI